MLHVFFLIGFKVKVLGMDLGYADFRLIQLLISYEVIKLLLARGDIFMVDDCLLMHSRRVPERTKSRIELHQSSGNSE